MIDFGCINISATSTPHFLTHSNSLHQNIFIINNNSTTLNYDSLRILLTEASRLYMATTTVK